MDELEAVWADLSQEMQNQVRTAIVNMVAERDGERVAAWSTLYSILAEVSYLGWQRVWRMVGAMPADAQPVVTSAFADTPMDIRGHVREIIATRAIADTLHDQRLAASVSRIEGVDQAGMAELASEGVIVEQNVVYHLPNGGALVISVDAHGYRGAMAMNLDEALELPALGSVEDERVACNGISEPGYSWQDQSRAWKPRLSPSTKRMPGSLNWLTLSELRTCIVTNRHLIPNHGQDFYNSEAIATGFVESTVKEGLPPTPASLLSPVTAPTLNTFDSRASLCQHKCHWVVGKARGSITRCQS